MKTMFTLSLAAIGASASLSRELRLIGEVDIDSVKVETRTRFESWMKLFNKEYNNSEIDEKYSTWKANDDFIQQFNKEGHSHVVGHNEFSDMSWDEFSKVYTGVKDKQKYLGRKKNVNHALASKAVVDAAPASLIGQQKMQ